MAKQTSIIWKDFYWGIAQDDFLTTWKQILYAENIDLTSSSDYVSLAKDSEWRFTTTDQVNWFIDAQSGTSKDVFAYTDDGKIYDTEDWTVESSAIWDKIYTAFKFNGYLYFVSNHPTAPFSRILESSAYNNTNWASLSVNFALWTAISTWAADIFPTLVYLDEYFYIGIGNTVYKVDDANVVESFDIFDGDVVGLTRVWGIIKVFTDKGTIAFWDWISSAVDSVISIQEPIRWVINNWKVDFIVSWHSDFQSRIKILNGYTVQGLSNARYSERLSDYIWKISFTDTNMLGKLWDTIYFVQDWITWNDLFRYWTNNPVLRAWFNVALAKDSNANLITKITSIYWIEFTSVDRVRIWVDSNSQNAFEYIDINTTSPTYKPSWYMILNPIDWWFKTIKKKIDKITLVTSNCDATETIEVLYSIDWWAFTSLQTINSWTSLTRTEIFSANDSFYDIQFKLNFASSGWADTPQFYELKLDYIEIEEK